MKKRSLAVVLLLVATSAVLAAARFGEHIGPSPMSAGQTTTPAKDMGRNAGSAAPAATAALGTSLAEWNRRNPMQGF